MHHFVSVHNITHRTVSLSEVWGITKKKRMKTKQNVACIKVKWQLCCGRGNNMSWWTRVLTPGQKPSPRPAVTLDVNVTLTFHHSSSSCMPHVFYWVTEINGHIPWQETAFWESAWTHTRGREALPNFIEIKQQWNITVKMKCNLKKRRKKVLFLRRMEEESTLWEFKLHWILAVHVKLSSHSSSLTVRLYLFLTTWSKNPNFNTLKMLI